MKFQLRKLNCCLAAAVAALLITGCVTGPLYHAVTGIPPGHGAVYFYGQNADQSAFGNIRYNNQPLASISPGTYYVQFPPAGTNDYTVPSASGIFEGWLVTKQRPGIVRVHIEAGKSYYFRVAGGGILRVRNTIGMQEIVQCRLVKGANPTPETVHK